MNLNGYDENEMSAQKKYKMQLQADIMRLKEKYQNIGTMKLSLPQEKGNNNKI